MEKKYRKKTHLITKNRNVLFIEEGGKLVLLKPYKEYQLERIVELKFRRDLRPLFGEPYAKDYELLVRDLSNGTKLICRLSGLCTKRMKKSLEVLLEEYREEPDEVMMRFLNYMRRVYEMRPDNIVYFYEKYREVEHREITEKDLPSWYYRDRENVLVQRAPEVERRIRKDSYSWREMMYSHYTGDHEGDVYLIRRLFDFGGDIIETREYVINHHYFLREDKRDSTLHTYYMYINGVGFTTSARESNVQIKL
ncbi:MAG: hypothetical protein ACTSPV_09620 [Candidatus Hodarchaeales archaeon]